MDAGALTLDEAADELYAGPPDEFIARRKDLVAQARGQKDRPLATAIGQLRRPTRTAWLLNLLAREHPDQIEQLLELGAALAEAQRNRAGAELRRLSAERRTVIETLTRSAVEAGAAHGHTATEATQAELAPTLTAALADPTVASELRQGRLTQAASYGGFGPELMLSPAGADGDPRAAAEGEPPADAEPGEGGAGAADEEPADEEWSQEESGREESGERAAAAEAARTARAEAEELAEAAEQAESAADSATEQADELADRVEQLRAELAEAEEAATQAAERARAARREYTKARDAAAAAEKAATEAEQAASEAP